MYDDIGPGVKIRKKVKKRNTKSYKKVKTFSTMTTPGGKCFFGLAVVAIAVAVFFLLRITANDRKDYVETVGYVVGYRENYDYDDDSYTWAETVQYTVDGRNYLNYSSSYSAFPKLKGAKVTIYYNRNNPSESTTDSPLSVNIGFVICGIFGVAGAFVIAWGIVGWIKGE